MGGGRVVRFRPAWQTVSGKPDESIQSRLEGVFRSALTVISATPAQHFFLQGDPPSGVHVVRRGTVILYSITEAGQRHIQQVARTGDCFAVDLSHPHRLSGQALTDVETWHVPRREASQAIETDAGARELVFDLMDQQLAAAHFRSELLNSRSAKQKCAAFLLSIEEAGTAAQASTTHISLKRLDIADYLGLTLETVSRVFNRLKNDGFIDLPHHDAFRITDRPRMRALAEDLCPTEWDMAC